MKQTCISEYLLVNKISKTHFLYNNFIHTVSWIESLFLIPPSKYYCCLSCNYWSIIRHHVDDFQVLLWVTQICDSKPVIDPDCRSSIVMEQNNTSNRHYWLFTKISCRAAFQQKDESWRPAVLFFQDFIKAFLPGRTTMSHQNNVDHGPEEIIPLCLISCQRVWYSSCQKPDQMIWAPYHIFTYTPISHIVSHLTDCKNVRFTGTCSRCIETFLLVGK